MRTRRFSDAALGVLAVVGAVLVFVATRRAMGTSPDSWSYIGTAGNLRSGRGLTVPFTTLTSALSPRAGIAHYGRVPLTDFPPLYPLLLATGDLVVGSVTTVARIGNALLLGAALFLVGVVARRAMPSSALALLVPVLVLIGPSLKVAFVFKWSWLVLASFVLSELLAATLAYAAIALLTVAFVQDRRELWAAGIGLTTLAVATRWSALAVAFACAIAVLLWPRLPLRARCVRGALVAGIPTAFALAWNVWSSGRAGEASRQLGVRIPRAGAWVAARRVLASWFAPAGIGAFGQLLIVVSLVALATWSVLAARTVARSDEEYGLAYATRLFLACFVVCAVGVNIAAQSVVDASLPIDARIVGIAQPAAYILVLSGITALRWDSSRRVAIALVAVVTVVAVVVAASGLPSTIDAVRAGEPMTGGVERPDRASALARRIRALPADARIFTSHPEVVYELSDRASLLVPLPRAQERGTRNTHYEEEVCDMARVLQERAGVLVMFPTFNRAVPTVGDLQRDIALDPVFQSDDGAILRVQRGCRPG
jgi:hypothetical protein